MNQQVTEERPSNAEAITQQRAANALATFRPPRLPFHPAIEERFGIDQASWRALVEAVFPLATSIDSVILALSYCRARKLDPFKRVVYIVPIWSKADSKMIDTVWPGIGELRTTAFRTGLYAGRDDAEFGPTLKEKVGSVELTFPEWCKVTVHRICGGETRSFAGPKVYWLETYATRGRNDESPNDMWAKRTRGQLEKCAEAAALRAAFPEELGDEETADEAESRAFAAKDVTPPPRPTRADFADGTPAVDMGEPASTVPTPEPFFFVDSDGVEHEVADPMDWVNRFYNALKEAAGNAQVATGIWETNSAQMERLRTEIEGGSKFADQIEDAYGAAIGSSRPAAVKNHTVGTEQKADEPREEKRANAPREIGSRIPGTEGGGFDWAKAGEELIKIIETSETVKDVRAWQELNMNRMENVSTNAPQTYAKLQKAIAALNERLAPAE